MSATQEVQKEQGQDAFLTIVGTGLYGIERFEEEAKRLGLQRALTFQMLRSMEFGDPILLAIHENEKTKDEVTGEVKENPRATIFGKSVVSGISYNLPNEVLEKVADKLNVTEIIPPSGPEERICGEYEVGGGYVVTDKLQDIVGYIEDACRELNLDPQRFKYFVRGAYQKQEPKIVLFGQKFFRGFKKIELPNIETAGATTLPSVLYIYDYKRRKYLKKEDKEALGIRD